MLFRSSPSEAKTAYDLVDRQRRKMLFDKGEPGLDALLRRRPATR